ncbi:HpcH/HpaI aldolase/citrate lyase family protein [Pararhodospirillum oryzae]|uniref:ATP-binding protein n=1 Tax=Pararhodospirillum oryzae TaxID=478448 RepID=A0A512HBP2_9PROT|nr:HpcH/HpaI aldolase/citrate lyase family protein [Pararhodospirillum oryzae]GEO82855.1 ATP-binding protein [Pararhodospirillum oryzae]
MSLSPLRLGASLYVPATRSDLVAVANGQRLPGVRSIILCTEDSVHADHVGHALDNLAAALPQIAPDGPLLFIRPRTQAVLARLLALPGIEAVHGFVLPKTTQDSLRDALAVLPEGSPHLLMPTLETREVFDPAALAALRGLLMAPEVRRRILALRIGGNDLFNLLSLRRRPGRTLYDTALGPVIAALVAAFRPFGFHLTAPVFDDFGDIDTLRAEVHRDLEHGLVGKTAIHPVQVAPIEREYRVSSGEVTAARCILGEDAPAVFQIDRVMCEPATHAAWARQVLHQAALYGVAEGDGVSAGEAREARALAG